MEADIVYRLKRKNYQGNTGPTAAIILKGETVDVQVLGSEEYPGGIDALVDLTGQGSIAEAGAYSFWILPEYIYITGTVDAIEIVNYEAEPLGVLLSN